MSIYAVFGAFAGMYGREERHQLRLYHQTVAASLLLTGVMVGAVLSALDAPHWVLVTVEASLAAVGSLVADRANLKPAGPFFGIFALGACASLPSIAPLPLIFAVVSGAAAFSVLLGFAGWARARKWEVGARRVTASIRGPRLRSSLVHALRYALAIGISGSVGQLTGDGHAYWAMAAAAVPLAGADFAGRIRRGIHRILGTFAGLGLTAVVLSGRPGVVALSILVAVFQFPTELFMARHYGLALVFFTPLILIMTVLAHPEFVKVDEASGS
ncbi:FUSC family protein [Arthrobacter sp. H14-L1]|uniref:FUSC family protein n=1 Tax=Arthrobacter sp. H14-L1 TaxID=2996697 RepID=UPI00226F1B16|nr:FUSC family protein [Arthrobacter sp. H14-L1]MCY0905903.1 FUSC family protein [Arthrobacter sp. H14-L1]